MKKSLLRLLRGALGAGGTFLIACAYGPVDDGGPLVSGRVLRDGDGLADLNVCTRLLDVDHCVRSGPGGNYELTAPQAVLDASTAGFTLCAEDDLNVTGGTVIRTCTTVPPGPVPFTVELEMDEPDPEL